MGATATLSTSALAVQPGQEATCSVVVRNAGAVVDQFAVDVVGDAAEWAVAEPTAVSLMPAQSATVTVRFTPPRSPEAPAGSVPFGVRVSSREDPAGSVVEEGVLDVMPFTDVAAEVVPAKAEGSRRAKYEVAIDNAGNYPVRIELHPSDREEELDFRLERSALVLDPGTTAFVRLRARPRHRFLRGQPRRYPFQVLVSVADAEPVLTEATMVQRPMLPKWLLPALAALLALAILLTTLWFTLLKPAVRSAAREAAAQQASEVKQAAEQARSEAGQAKQNADKAMRASGLDPNDPKADPNNPTRVNPPGSAGDPTDFRVAANAPIDADATRFREFPYSPPDSTKSLVITDLVLQNPRGDSGTLRILRDSDGRKAVLLEVGLNNFRDLDQHWLQPWRFRPGEKVVVAVSCQNPGDRGNCTPAVSFSGRVEG
jgi:hypothetical protein